MRHGHPCPKCFHQCKTHNDAFHFVLGKLIVFNQKQSNVRDRNINALRLRPIVKRTASLDIDMAETPKTPREIIQEMSRPMVIFGSSTPVTPTVFPNFSVDQEMISSTPGLATDGSSVDESDDYSWDFKCKGTNDSGDDLADTFDVLCDLNRNVQERAHPDALSPSENDSHLAKILEEVENNLISRYAKEGMYNFDEVRPAFSTTMPILCIADENPPSSEPLRRPISIVISNTLGSLPEQAHRTPTVRHHIRSTSLSKSENAPLGQSMYPARSITRGSRGRASTAHGKKRTEKSRGLR